MQMSTFPLLLAKESSMMEKFALKEIPSTQAHHDPTDNQISLMLSILKRISTEEPIKVTLVLQAIYRSANNQHSYRCQ